MNNTLMKKPISEIDYEDEYNNSGRVENAADLIAAYSSEAASYREKVGERAQYNLHYGHRERNVMDIFWPNAGRDENVPIAMFIHGGYWQGLSKDAFSHMASGLNEHGIAVAIPSYTLCPDASVSEIIEEIRHACLYLWITQGKRITVYGHSAGGHLAACMVATVWEKIHSEVPHDLVTKGMGFSGLYDLAPLVKTSVNDALKLTDTSAFASSPAQWLVDPDAQMHVVVGGDESAEYLRQSNDLQEIWHLLGAHMKQHVVPGKNHFTIVDDLTDSNSLLTVELESLITGRPPKTFRLPQWTVQEDVKRRLSNYASGTSPKLGEGTTDRKKTSTFAPEKKSAAQTGEFSTARTKSNDGNDAPKRPEEVTPRKSEFSFSIEILLSDKVQNLRKSRVDNLSKIKKLTTAQKKRLAELGINSFAQIAALDIADIAEVNRVLGVRGQIEREHWITQARHQQALIDMPPWEATARKPARKATSTKPTTKVEAKAPSKQKAKAKPKKQTTASTKAKPKVSSKPDDLTLISGVGPVLKDKLYAMGIKTFADIAAFKKSDIDRVDDALSFKGRIERDKWVAQAKKLAKQSKN